MAFVLDYLREFPGADYRLVRKAALGRGLPAPPPIVYGNALRVLKLESARAAEPAAPAGQRRRGRAARRVQDLGTLVEQMQSVVAERDRLRDAFEEMRRVLKDLRR
jgi:hypothetical protein